VYPHRRSWYAYEYDWGEIEQLDFGSWFVKRDPHHQFKRGHISKEEMAEYSGERTLSLQQALAFTYQKQWRVLIEIKNLTATPGHTTVVPKVIEYIRRFDMVERAMIISFEESYLQQVKALEPSIATGFITYHKNKNHFDFAKKLNVQAYIASTGVFEHDEFHKKHLPSLRQAGILTYVWTVNDANQMSKFIQLGVDGIITDFPQRLTNLLRTC
jgi:glycerophosphoryl diester phosphodiesterase